MKSTFIFLLVICFNIIAKGQDQADHHALTLPLAPPDLLAILPAAPTDKDGTWKIKQSRAFNEYESNWLISDAVRAFTFIPNPDNADPNAKPAKPKTVRIEIIDTGFSPEMSASFLSAKTDKGSTPGEIAPFSTAKTGDNAQTLFWIGQRFIVKIIAVNNEPDAYKKWIALIDSNKLISAPATAIDKVPRPYKAIRIDELNPANNASSNGYYTTPEEATQFAEQGRAEAIKAGLKVPTIPRPQ